jgi:hypothetical protein
MVAIACRVLHGWCGCTFFRTHLYPEAVLVCRHYQWYLVEAACSTCIRPDARPTNNHDLCKWPRPTAEHSGILGPLPTLVMNPNVTHTVLIYGYQGIAQLSDSLKLMSENS